MTSVLDLQVQMVPTDSLLHYPGNARQGNVAEVARSLRANGMYRPLVVQATTSYVLAGNHTLDAAVLNYEEDLAGGVPDSPWARVPVTFVDVDDEHARRIVLVDNRTSDLAGYDEEALFRLLAEVPDLEGTGYEEDDRDVLRRVWDAENADPDDEEDALPVKGELLALADVAVAEPDHQPPHGSVWKVGRHTLVVARVSDEHTLWSVYLEAETVFCPYPEPYLTATELAYARPLLLVQPNRYLAGHLLDKHSAMWPGSIEQLA